MSRKTLDQLGWGRRRLTIVMRREEWEELENRAAALNIALADLIGADVALVLREERQLDRVSLTPEGEKIAVEGAYFGPADPDIIVGPF